jgi:hypothetical protein
MEAKTFGTFGHKSTILFQNLTRRRRRRRRRSKIHLSSRMIGEVVVTYSQYIPVSEWAGCWGKWRTP